LGKQYLKRVVLVVAVALLIGCGDGSSSGSLSELVGTWVTESCSQVTDGSGNPLPMWLKAEYEFTPEGLITWRFFSYDDGQCITGGSLNSTSDHENGTFRLFFEDMGNETLQEGLLGHRLHFQLNEGDAVVVDSQDVFAAILNNYRLCTSENLRLGGSSIVYSDIANPQINFEECLVRDTLP